jgi:excisionase family DNA binding protein
MEYTVEAVFKEVSKLRSELMSIQEDQKQILTAAEAATLLSISKSQLYKYVESGQLPSYRPGGKKLFFKRQEIVEWILSYRQLTNQDVQSKVEEYLHNKEGGGL